MAWTASHHHMTQEAAAVPWETAAEGGGASCDGVWYFWVFPPPVQSQPAAVVLCIFQIQLNGPGWGLGGGKEGRQQGRRNEHIRFLTHIDYVYTVETWLVDKVTGKSLWVYRLVWVYQGVREIFIRLQRSVKSRSHRVLRCRYLEHSRQLKRSSVRVYNRYHHEKRRQRLRQNSLLRNDLGKLHQQRLLQRRRLGLRVWAVLHCPDVVFS